MCLLLRAAVYKTSSILVILGYVTLEFENVTLVFKMSH